MLSTHTQGALPTSSLPASHSAYQRYSHSKIHTDTRKKRYLALLSRLYRTTWSMHATSFSNAFDTEARVYYCIWHCLATTKSDKRQHKHNSKIHTIAYCITIQLMHLHCLATTKDENRQHTHNSKIHTTTYCITIALLHTKYQITLESETWHPTHNTTNAQQYTTARSYYCIWNPSIHTQRREKTTQTQ
jgi:hypothetical protein